MMTRNWPGQTEACSHFTHNEIQLHHDDVTFLHLLSEALVNGDL